jgi:hypothetical protein
LMTETVASSLLYWDLVDAANMDCPRVENAERVNRTNIHIIEMSQLL